QDQNLVPAVQQTRGQLPDVHLDASGGAPVVGTGQGDPHGAGGSPSTSASQAGWNMCQSTGADAICRSNCPAMRRVRVVTSSRITPVRSNVIGSLMTQCQPWAVVKTAHAQRGAPVASDRRAGPAGSARLSPN